MPNMNLNTVGNLMNSNIQHATEKFFNRKINTYLFSALLPILILLSSCSDNNSFIDTELANKLEQILIENLEEFDVPGALVGVWIPGEGRLILEEGTSDISDDKPIIKEDHVRIGSVTKSFTVNIILQLAGEGLLSLDDPLSKYFPDIENSDSTIGDLANMRSGIYNYTEDPEFAGSILDNLLTKFTEQDLVDVADRNLPYFPPDGGWHYSNTSTVILGMIVEQVTGNPLGEEIQNRIITPLGLEGTSYPDTPDMPLPFSNGYIFLGPDEGFSEVTFVDPSLSAGSGAMISSLEDLRIWAEALGEGTLLESNLFLLQNSSLSPITFDPCDDVVVSREKRTCPEYDKYGLGIGEISGWIGHTGEYIGFTSLVMYDPESGSVVVIVMNIFGAGEHVPTKVFRELAEILNN